MGARRTRTGDARSPVPSPANHQVATIQEEKQHSRRQHPSGLTPVAAVHLVLVMVVPLALWLGRHKRRVVHGGGCTATPISRRWRESREVRAFCSEDDTRALEGGRGQGGSSAGAPS
jgi:hypothetical protein